MFKRLLNRITIQFKPKAKAIIKRKKYGLDNLEDDSIGYPARPDGIPVVQTEILFQRMETSINLIKNEIGVSKEVFQEYILPVFFNFVSYADLLPASEYKHHATGGGLISHSLDVAFRAMRAAQMTHFPISTNSLTETQQSNVQWRVATVLAALLHDGGKILADVQVHDGKGKVSERIVWDAQCGQTIHDWAADNKIERYFVSWNRDRHMKHMNASLVVMERLIPSKTWSWLEKCYDGKQIHSMMLASVGKTNMSHPMPQIITEADSASTKADMFSRSSHITKEIKKVPLSELLCDLMLHYILTKKWKINEKNAEVWFVNDHLYIVWHNAVPELAAEMIGAGYSIPSVPEVLGRIMIEEGQAVANKDELFFDIYPEILGDARKPVRIKALKMHNVQRVVVDLEKLYSLQEHKKTPKANNAVNETSTDQATSEPDNQLINEIFDDSEHDDNGDKKPTNESSKETLVRILSNIAASRKAQLTTPIKEADCTTTLPQGSSSDNEPNPGLASVPPEQYAFTTEVAKFVMSNFNYEVEDNKIQVSGDDLGLIVEMAEMQNIPLTINILHASEELCINEQ